MTVVATPEPDGPPNKKDDMTIVRPTPELLPPIAAKEKSIKNLPAPVNCKKAPKIVNKIIKKLGRSDYHLDDNIKNFDLLLIVLNIISLNTLLIIELLIIIFYCVLITRL